MDKVPQKPIKNLQVPNGLTVTELMKPKKPELIEIDRRKNWREGFEYTHNSTFCRDEITKDGANFLRNIFNLYFYGNNNETKYLNDFLSQFGDSLCSFELKVHCKVSKYAKEHYPTKIFDSEKEVIVYVICRKENVDEVIIFIEKYADNNNRSELSLADSVCGLKNTDTVGWLINKCGFAFFTDKIMFENFKGLLGIKE